MDYRLASSSMTLGNLELSQFKVTKIARQIFLKIMTDTDSIGQTPSSLERYLVLSNSEPIYLSINLCLSADFRNRPAAALRVQPDCSCRQYISQRIVRVSLIMSPHYDLSPAVKIYRRRVRSTSASVKLAQWVGWKYITHTRTPAV